MVSAGPPALKKQDQNVVSFDGTLPDCDAYAVGKSHHPAHSETADHEVKHSFQLAFTNLMELTTPEALGGYKYVRKSPSNKPS